MLYHSRKAPFYERADFLCLAHPRGNCGPVLRDLRHCPVPRQETKITYWDVNCHVIGAVEVDRGVGVWPRAQTKDRGAGPVVGQDGVEVIEPHLGQGLDRLEHLDRAGRPGQAGDARGGCW